MGLLRGRGLSISNENFKLGIMVKWSLAFGRIMCSVRSFEVIEFYNFRMELIA